jgi:hypothetical protein
VRALWVRRVVIAVCVAGIAGMIAASIAERTGAAITAGLVTAFAVVCLVLVTAVAPPAAFGAPPPVDEDAAADLERRVADLVATGADEREVRALVRAAVRLGRRHHPE